MTVGDRLQVILRNRKQFPPIAEGSAGRNAELRVAGLLDKRLADSAYDYVASLRVPGKTHRHEIDFIITTTDEIWVVELKNWSGVVGLDGDRVIQHRSGGRGVIDHGQLLTKLRRKQRALKSFLQQQIDEVPPLWSVLVFYHPHLTLSPEFFDIDDLDVVKLPEFLSALPTPTASDRGLWHWLGRLFGATSTEDLPRALPAVSESISQARQALNELGSWDLLMLHGGRLLSGDLIDSSVAPLRDRDRFKRLSFDVPRHFIDLFRGQPSLQIRARTRRGEYTTLTADFDDTLRFHAAGQPNPQTIELRHLQALGFGYTTETRR